jgi:hypothetical protein
MSVHLSLPPSWSPDLAPSDFFILRYMKKKIPGLQFDSTEDLLYWIVVELERKPLAVFENVIKNWINRLENYMECK